MGRNSVHKIKKAPRYSNRESIVHLEDEHDLFDLIQRT
ncbi:MAG: 23S rRNA (guanosine(2251)-2'-O)-methyltransferase RlmB, partial [Coraliomargarita sp.]|nr:23S rRNA (guanosine(2251)-2'-O)-methyltransferase RlmB [Coraliomargarita sp.]